MTKTDLARASQVHPTLVHRIENGERRATDPVIHAFAVALKVPVTALLGPAPAEESADA